MQNVHWGWAIGAFVVLEVIMIASAVLWVAIYSHLLNPGLEALDYQNYAKSASPVVSLVVGIPVFFASAWLIVRKLGTHAKATLIAIIAIYLVVDAAVILAVADDQRYNLLMLVANDPTKVLASFAGYKLAMRKGTV